MTWCHSTPPSWYRIPVWDRSWSKRNGVHYVGDDVILDWLWRGDTNNYLYRRVETGFEWGVDGEALVITDRELWMWYGSILGSPTYSSTHANLGNLAMKVSGAATVATAWAPTIHSGRKDQYGRTYVYLTANPTGAPGWLIRTAQAGIWINTNGKIGFGVFGLDFNFTNAVALNQWIRIEWRMKWDAVQANTVFEVKLFNDGDSTTPTEVQTQTNCLFASSNDSLTIGANGNNPITPWGSDFWVDDVVASADSYPGPASHLEHQPPASPITYLIRDYYGNEVSTGSFEEGLTWFRPYTPDGGWLPGWYRVYLTGPQSDANYGNSYGATNLCVIRDDENFTTMPAGNTAAQNEKDFVLKGVMGLGTSRMELTNAASPATEVTTIQSWKAVADDYWSDNGLPDSERPARENWVAFTGQTWDSLVIAGASSGSWGAFYPIDGSLDGDQIFVTVSAGTNANTDKVRIHYPTSGTLVETFDNLASQSAAETAINASSTKVRFFGYDSTRAAYPAQAAIGSTYRDGVVSAVSSLYSSGITRFEGPTNEGTIFPEGVQHMKLFQAAVHAGNASAKAIGPCFVAIPPVISWTAWLDAGGGSYCDEISFHAYNAATNGDMNLGKYTMQTFVDLLASYGLSSKVLWQTESVGPFEPVYGIYHPRRSRKPLMETLLMERYGVARERNSWWYDISHGFWDFPAWLINGDGSVDPAVVLGRVLAEETWGKPYASALDFGTLGNAMFLGNVYSGTTGKTVALMATSFMTGASVTLTITGDAGPFTVVDGFGRERTAPLSNGRLTVSLTEVPSYVRLPSTASVSVYRINDHSPRGVGASIAPSATTKQIDGVTYTVIADNGYQTVYGPGTGSAPDAGDGWYAEPPSTTTLIWTDFTTIDRVIVWCASCWQLSGVLIDFDVQTYNGSVWTTQKTVTKDTPSWFEHSTNETNVGCFEETYWDEQWMFDIKLPTAISCRGVRLNVREASYGGEPLPDGDIAHGAGGGQGINVQGYRLQEIAVVNSNRYAGAA